jgi:hypothetical protein
MQFTFWKAMAAALMSALLLQAGDRHSIFGLQLLVVC